MKNIILFILFVFSLNYLNAQDILIQSISGKESLVLSSDKKSVKITFGNNFKAETNSFNLVNDRIYSDSLNLNKIGEYNKKRLKFDDGRYFKYQLDNKNKKIFIYNEDKKVVFEGKLIYDEKFNILKSIEIVKNNIDTKVEAWVALVTIQKIYGNENKEILGYLAFGAVAGIIAGLFTL
jgi:hypothetical protein